MTWKDKDVSLSIDITQCSMTNTSVDVRGSITFLLSKCWNVFSKFAGCQWYIDVARPSKPIHWNRISTIQSRAKNSPIFPANALTSLHYPQRRVSSDYWFVFICFRLQVVTTGKYPVELQYVPPLDQVWVLNWRSERDAGVKTIQVIRDAAQKKKHRAVHPDPIDGQFDLVRGLYIPQTQVRFNGFQSSPDWRVFPFLLVLLARERTIDVVGVRKRPFRSFLPSPDMLGDTNFFIFICGSLLSQINAIKGQ